VAKERLDTILVTRGFFPSREKAADAIRAGAIFVNNKCIRKAGTKIEPEEEITVEESKILSYVSKGGLKLEKGIHSFRLDFKDKVILDVGCSTGGFTDCALQHGAQFVYGIDVGIDQLDKSLRDCPKLKAMENLHVKDLRSEHLDGKTMDAIVVDVSFISVTRIFPYFLPFLHEEGFVFILIKPQFELNSLALDRHGIVQDPKDHAKAIQRVIAAAKKSGLYLYALDYSPLALKKNTEFMALFRLKSNELSININKITERAEKAKLKMKKLSDE
jgi:23S rRNA (cytidine1920-2'-O)/16S rRNA (cytidine1409-2'-O)-methyltransferase